MSNIPPHLDSQIQHMDSRLERIEQKLDDHLQRVSIVERDVEWIRGHLKISLTAALAVIGFLGTYLVKYITKQ